MDGPQFDRFVRRLATAVSRRGVLASLVASSAAAVVATKPGLAVAAQSTPEPGDVLEEYSVELYEQLITLIDQTQGNCAEMGQAASQFMQQHADDFTRISAEQSAWSHDRRQQHVTLYGDRIERATQTFHSAMARCGFHADGGVSGLCPAAIHATPSNRLLPARFQDSCQCNQECPLGIGDCAQYIAACAVGDHCACCQTAYCGGTSHCESNCRDNECCAEPCGDTWVPCPPPG